MCYFFIIMDTVYGLISLIMISCIFDESASQPENLASIFNSSSLHFLRMIQYRFCGTKNQCDKNLTFEDPESVNIYESFKSVIPTTSVIPITVSHEYSRVKCCKSCSCDLSTCQERGTCCTDILTPDIVTSETYSTFTCESAQLRPSKSEVQNGNSLWMIGKCSMAFVSDTDKAVIKRKCENGTEYLGLDTTSPVTDIESQITYRNRYCLECNNKSIKNAVIWNGRLRCTEDEAAALLNLDSDNIIGSITRTKTCNIVYERPPGTTFEVTNCNLGISKCNVTGRLAVYDPFIEAACHMFTNKIKTYKNVFCYMCNTIVTQEWCYVLVRSKTYPPLFSSLLKYMPDNTHKNNADDVDTSACTDSQIYDMMQNTCRNLSCRFPKTLERGQCVNLVETLAGVSYMMYLKFTPLNKTKYSDFFHLTNSLVTVVDNKLTRWGIKTFVYNYTVLYKVETTENELTNTSTRHMDTNIIVPSMCDVTEDRSIEISALIEDLGDPIILNSSNTKHSPTTADIFQTTSPIIPILSINNTISYILFRIGFYINAKVDQINISVLDDILNIEGEHITANDIYGHVNGHFKVSLDDFTNADFTAGKDVYMKDTEDGETLGVFPITFTPIVDVNRQMKPVIIAEKLACPLVYVDTHELTVKKLDNTIDIYGTKIERKYFYRVALESTGSGCFYLVCVDKFLQALNNVENPDTVYQTQTVKRILSITLVMLSVTCCLLTFLTYSLFKDLRSQPGLNNMCLVSNLIIAQLLFQFGSGQAGLIPDWACKTIGALVHFFWLEVIFWMNVCTYHMFNVFGNIRHVENRQTSNRLRMTLKYTVYCFFSSALFVVINIGVVSASSKNERIGYGDQVCYISRRDMIGYVFAFPIFLTIFTNLTLFGIVIFKISRLPTIDSSLKSNRNYISIYAKLASITGITWITGVLIYFTDIEIFEYIFIILNAGQGIFIFLSFVCNKRVFRLYKTLLIGQKPAKQRNKQRNKSNATRETTFSSGDY